MKRPLRPEELRLWSVVAATVHPLAGRARPALPEAQSQTTLQAIPPRAPIPATAPIRRAAGALQGPETIEPRRRQRLARERDDLGPRLDLHGLDQDRARAALEAFLNRAWGDGYRAVLIITGKGVQGDGVLKRRVPDWLGAAHLAPIVAGVSEAHRRHGGEGALYVALKRRPRGG